MEGLRSEVKSLYVFERVTSGAEAQCLCGFNGTAKAVPFQNDPFPNPVLGEDAQPQGLKPNVYVALTAQLKLCPFKTIDEMSSGLVRGDLRALSGDQLPAAVKFHIDVRVAAVEGKTFAIEVAGHVGPAGYDCRVVV